MRDYSTVRAQKREEPAEGQTMRLYERKAVQILSLPISSKSLPKHKSLKAKKQRFLILWDSAIMIPESQQSTDSV